LLLFYVGVGDSPLNFANIFRFIDHFDCKVVFLYSFAIFDEK